MAKKRKIGRNSEVLESIKKEEKKIESNEEDIKKVESQIKRIVEIKSLNRVTIKDINRGIIGAFIGVVAHFGFIYGKEIAQRISTSRATFIFIFSYLLITILMYETGYRKIKEKRILKFLPLRATVIYFVSLAVIIFIFFLFNQIDFGNIGRLYSEVAVTSVLAVLGAGTADLIGR